MRCSRKATPCRTLPGKPVAATHPTGVPRHHATKKRLALLMFFIVDVLVHVMELREHVPHVRPFAPLQIYLDLRHVKREQADVAVSDLSSAGIAASSVLSNVRRLAYCFWISFCASGSPSDSLPSQRNPPHVFWRRQSPCRYSKLGWRAGLSGPSCPGRARAGPRRHGFGSRPPRACAAAAPATRMCLYCACG